MDTLRLTDEQRRMVADNHNPIYAYLHSKRLPVDDFYGLAAVGLCKAALAYDPARGKFSTLAWQTMSREIGNEFRVRSTARRTAEVISLDAGDTAEGLHGLITDDDAADDPSNLVDAWHLIDRLRALASDRDRRILAYRMLGYTNDDIGPKVGLGRGGVSFAVRAIRNRLGVLA